MQLRLVVPWLAWFFFAAHLAVEKAHQAVDAVSVKARFWNHWSAAALNERQVNVLNRLLDGFEGKLTAQKWASIGKRSSDTAVRDIGELLWRGLLLESDRGGRKASYVINEPRVSIEATQRGRE